MNPWRSISEVGIVDRAEDEQRWAELLDGIEGFHPKEVLLEDTDEALGAAVPSGARTKAGELSMPRNSSSFWNASAMYCEP